MFIQNSKHNARILVFCWKGFVHVTLLKNTIYAKTLLLGKLSKVGRLLKWQISNKKQQYALFSFRRHLCEF